MSFPGGSAGKESTFSVGDLGLIAGMGRSPGEAEGYPLQYSGLENSMDYMVHGVLKSDTTGPLSLSGHFTFDRHLYLKVLSEENKGVIHSNSI